MTILERMVLAVEKVRDRLLRASRALATAGIGYAVVGGNAVAAWVAKVDAGAVRNTQDVDLLLDRKDLAQATQALKNAGFSYRHAAGVDMFLDGPQARARDAVHIVFAEEKVRPDYPLPTPALDEVEPFDEFVTLRLDALVRMKLTSYRRKDQVHILDLIGVGLVDETWLERLPSELLPRLRELLESKEE
ncbi:hypothetical protein DYH09_13745 [bacterium CPR1]|nr:hypothetical protein [bacterium CPR1]